jgi:biopolymer transport protein ExbD
VKLSRSLRFNPALACVLPLVNVLFLVLLFFVLSSRFVLQPGLAVHLPSSRFTLGPQKDAQIVSIVSTPIPSLYYRDQKLSLEELVQQLGHVEKRERSLILRADRNTPYSFVVEVMNRALQNGYTIVLATAPERP